jgi:hypothetical protein
MTVVSNLGSVPLVDDPDLAGKDCLRRHVGISETERAQMLGLLGYGAVDEFIEAAVPAGVRGFTAGCLPPLASEADVLAEPRRIAAENVVQESMIGFGRLRDCDTERDSTQRTREPGVLHRLHPVSAGNQRRSLRQRVACPRPNRHLPRWSPQRRRVSGSDGSGFKLNRVFEALCVLPMDYRSEIGAQRPLLWAKSASGLLEWSLGEPAGRG